MSYVTCPDCFSFKVVDLVRGRSVINEAYLVYLMCRKKKYIYFVKVNICICLVILFEVPHILKYLFTNLNVSQYGESRGHLKRKVKVNIICIHSVVQRPQLNPLIKSLQVL